MSGEAGGLSGQKAESESFLKGCLEFTIESIIVYLYLTDERYIDKVIEQMSLYKLVILSGNKDFPKDCYRSVQSLGKSFLVIKISGLIAIVNI